MSPARGQTNRRRGDRQHTSLPRMRNPSYDIDKLRKAIIDAADGITGYGKEGWVHTRFVASKLGVSVTTARRWCSDAAARGLIESRELHSWWYSKSMLSRHWRVRL